MKKKLVSLCLALLLLAGACFGGATAQAAGRFTDVPANIWYAAAVDYVSTKGLFQGDTATTFAPNVTMNRGMFVTVLGRLAGVDQKKYTKSYFKDVSAGAYYSPYVQWAASYEVVKGSGDYVFAPNDSVQRQQIAAFLYRFAEATGNDVSYDLSVLDQFPDAGKTAGYAKIPMAWAVGHKVINGSDGMLKPAAPANRSQVAQIFYNIENSGLFPTTKLTRDPIALKEPPAEKPEEKPEQKPEEKPEEAPAGLNKFTKTVSGVSVSGVEFDPSQGYGATVVLGNDKLYSWEPSSSIVKRTGAAVAVNGAFFQSYEGQPNFLTTYSSIVKDGVPLQLDNANTPQKPSFVVDSQGKASIQFFKTVQNVELWQNGAKKDTLKEVGCNMPLKSDADATPMIYTAAYGSALDFSVVRAVEADASGKITKVYKSGGSKLSIPKTGFLLVERKLRWEGEKFVLNCEVGDELKRVLSYEGSSTQNIVTALSCGPCVVKAGKVYGNSSTYVAEGFTDPAVTAQARNRMAIGVKKDGTVVIASITSSVTLGQLSQIMLGLGCTDAMNLDGGGSTNLYVNGSWIVGPTGRNMSNMLVFTKK